VAVDNVKSHFTYRRFEHGAQCKLPTHEIAKRSKFGPMVIARGPMVCGPGRRLAPVIELVTWGLRGSNLGHQF
jgi:hypothetical protein